MNNPDVPVDAIGRAASIHFVMMPEPDMFACCDDPVIRRQMNRLMMAIEMGRVQRERKTISLKMPVRKMVIASNDKQVLEDIHSLEGYLMEELNCLEVVYDNDESAWCKCSITPEFSVLGRKLGKDFKRVMGALAKLTAEDVEKMDKEHKITVEGFELTEEDVVIKREFQCAEPQYEGSVSSDHSFVAAIDTTQDDEIFALGIAREFVNRVQKMRKSAGLVPSDRIKVFYAKKEGDDESVEKAVEAHKQSIEERLDCTITNTAEVPASESVIISGEDEISEVKFQFTLTRA